MHAKQAHVRVSNLLCSYPKESVIIYNTDTNTDRIDSKNREMKIKHSES